MPWKWYSDYNIDPSASSNKDLTRDEIKECICLFCGSSKVHRDDHFNTTTGTSLDVYCDRLIKSADDGYLVMALNPATAGRKATTLFFQKSKALTSHFREDVWVASLGLDDSDFPDKDDEPAASRGFLRSRFNSALDLFMKRIGVKALYSVDAANNTTPSPWGRPISRLEFYGLKRKGVPDGTPGHAKRSDWEQDGTESWFSGPDGWIEHWAGNTGKLGPGWWSFRVIKIKRR